MKYSKSLLLAATLLSTVAAHADSGDNSFESRSQPQRHMITQSHPAHGWHVNRSHRDDTGPDTVEVTGLAVVSAVPEPETYAMMLAGIGLIGTIIRRRRARQES